MVPVTKYVPVPGPTVEKTVYVDKEVPVVVKPAKLPHSSVMRAVADANERQAYQTVEEQRNVAGKLEAIEAKTKINEAINKSVREEEQKVIDAANKRMAEVHAKKAQEAAKAAKAIDDARAATSKKVEKAK